MRVSLISSALFILDLASAIKKGPGISAKSLIQNPLMVGGASFELATPAV
jgi:hypothetical protein